MANRHIAFLCFPHQPHVHPTLSIVSTLVRRGYRVSYVTSKRFSAAVDELGGEPLPCPTFLTLAPGRKPSGVGIQEMTDQTLVAVEEFYRRNRPSLIVYDRAFLAGRLLAIKLGVRAITTSPVLAFEKADVAFLPESARKWRSALIEFSRVLDSYLEKYGVHGDDAFFHDEELNIYLYPQIYQLVGVSTASTFYAGRCAAERPYHGTWRTRLAGDRPIMLVSVASCQLSGSGELIQPVAVGSPLIVVKVNHAATSSDGLASRSAPIQ